MAKNFNIRRSAVNYTDNVKDACDRLSQVLCRSNFIDMEVVKTSMNGLNYMSLANIEMNIDKAEATITAAETLRDVFKNLKKWKEAQKKLMLKDDVARMKDEQKEHHKMELDRKMDVPDNWSLADDSDNNFDLDN